VLNNYSCYAKKNYIDRSFFLFFALSVGRYFFLGPEKHYRTQSFSSIFFVPLSFLTAAFAGKQDRRKVISYLPR